jgi:hypothetical protein
MMSSRSSNANWNDVGWLKQTTATTRAHPTTSRPPAGRWQQGGMAAAALKASPVASAYVR